MKTCSKCGKRKQLCRFGISSRHSDGRASECKECKNIYSREHYRQNRDKYFEREKIRRKEMMDEYYGWLSTQYCKQCGYRGILALELHHENDDKDIGVSRLMMYKSRKRLWDEVNRCIVLCSNCHAIETAKERGWYKFKYAKENNLLNRGSE